MSKLLRSFSLIFTVFAGLSLAGCTTALELAFEDRSSEDIGTDSRIKTEVLANIADQVGASPAASTSAIVYEQVVMLTGAIEKSSDKSKIVTITKNVAGVRDVINELKTARTDAKTEDSVDDFLINQTIHAQAAANTFIHHTNWRWNSVDGTVYLFGRSLSNQETSDMKRLVSGIDGVKKVVNHAYVKSKPKS